MLNNGWIILLIYEGNILTDPINILYLIFSTNLNMQSMPSCKCIGIKV